MAYKDTLKDEKLLAAYSETMKEVLPQEELSEAAGGQFKLAVSDLKVVTSTARKTVAQARKDLKAVLLKIRIAYKVMEKEFNDDNSTALEKAEVKLVDSMIPLSEDIKKLWEDLAVLLDSLGMDVKDI